MAAGEKRKIELTMYGVAEVLKWCIQKNQGRIPGVDTEGFKKLQEALAQKPQVGDYYTLDKFWKQKMVFEFTPEEIETINRCLYDIPNFDGLPLPQIRFKFWPPAEVGPPEPTPAQSESEKKEPIPG
ncbi:MAG: hypothetical protein D6690_03640 [Nitrospirae bacterium]|nr:MAG: hypothetical protein D6690_03640 [Nitrospirota bacterium]